MWSISFSRITIRERSPVLPRWRMALLHVRAQLATEAASCRARIRSMLRMTGFSISLPSTTSKPSALSANACMMWRAACNAQLEWGRRCNDCDGAHGQPSDAPMRREEATWRAACRPGCPCVRGIRQGCQAGRRLSVRFRPWRVGGDTYGLSIRGRAHLWSVITLFFLWTARLLLLHRVSALLVSGDRAHSRECPQQQSQLEHPTVVLWVLRT
jgi:hypothetical protein